VDASAYALVDGLRSTRATLAAWRRRPWPVLGRWLLGAVALAVPVLIASAGWEVYVAPHVLSLVVGRG
jgi:hypothetical protein